MTRRLISALLAAALLPLAAAPAVAGAPDRPERAERTAQVKIVATSSPFSPNGDGHRDRTTVRYRLTDDARVSVEVTYRGKTVFRTTPKATRAGTRSFRWDGTRTSGKRAADARYRVVVQATTHGTTRTDSTTVAVRTRPTRVDGGTLKLSSGTVYPYAKAINDVVVGNFDLTDPFVVAGNEGRREPWRVIGALRAQVLDRTGRVISTEPLMEISRANEMDDAPGCYPCGRFTWDGRDSVGVLLEPGAYRIRVVQGRDSAGNTRVLSGTRTVRISRAQLERTTTVVDLTAAATPQTLEPQNGCNGCIHPCTPSASTRYPGGLTFVSDSTPCRATSQYFTVPVPGRRTPYDAFSVTATGGPSTSGASASAELTPGAYSHLTRTMTGDTTTPVSDLPMTANSEVYPTGWPDAVIWSVDSLEGSYDIASFQVKFYTFVPVA